MIKLNSLTIDAGILLSGLKPYLLDALRQAEDKLLDIMEKEVGRTVHGNGPGKPAWRERLKQQLRVVEEQVTDAFLEAKVGVDPNIAFTDFIKAMLISEGAGSAAGGSPISAGPPGRSVWDGDLSSQHPSNAKSSYLLPGAFNQPGNHFVQNAIRLMKLHFDDVLATAMANIPSSVFSAAVQVSAG